MFFQNPEDVQIRFNKNTHTLIFNYRSVFVYFTDYLYLLIYKFNPRHLKLHIVPIVKA